MQSKAHAAPRTVEGLGSAANDLIKVTVLQYFIEDGRWAAQQGLGGGNPQAGGETPTETARCSIAGVQLVSNIH